MSIGIRLDIVFSVYAIFAVAIIVRYGWRVAILARGVPTSVLDGDPRT